MLRSLAVGCALLAGCHEVFSKPAPPLVDGFVEPTEAALVVDIDNDGRPDSMDDCIQAAEDLEADEDATEPLNASDPCPLDATHQNDPDSDDLPIQCDPLPEVGFDGHRRCFMGFTSRSLNQNLWSPRESEVGWSAGNGELVFNNLSTNVLSLLATQDLVVARTITLDTLAEVTSPGNNVRLVLWLAANDPQSPSDVGCQLEVRNNMFFIQVLGDGAENGTSLAQFSTPALVRVRATYARGAGPVAVRCEASIGNVIMWVASTSTMQFPATGRFGFGARSASLTVKALDILEHP